MIKTITVIGSGLMGSAIAAHFTNCGCKVNLLDILSKKNSNRNILAEKSIKKLLKIKPSPITLKSNIKNIIPGNIDDDLEIINESDWIIEAIVENLEIKQKLYEKIEKIMKKDLIISSNTSTIPISKLTKGRNDIFKKNFLITHFFNPPRYLKLLEIVCSEKTNQVIKEKIINFSDFYLGKSIIETKDTPGFIGNRIGIFWIERAAIEAINHNLSVEEADILIKNIFNVPKTGVFGLIDIVGLDLIPTVVKSLLENIPKNDLYKKLHKKPEIFDFMISNKFYGRKAESGFYKLVNKDGGKIKYSLNLQTKKYESSHKALIPNFNLIKKNLKQFLEIENKYSFYCRRVLLDILYYVLLIYEEISSDIISIDTAMKDGFGWKLGPFEIIDILGSDWIKNELQKEGLALPKLLNLIENKIFYKVDNNEIKYFDFIQNKYKKIKRGNGIILLSDIKKVKKPIKKISTASLWDIDDGITVFEIHSKSNTLDINTLEFLNQMIDLVSSSYKAMIIYNEGEFFSAGANLGEAMFLGNIGLESELDKILTRGQEVFTKLKYSNFPVVAAPFNLTLGGACEIVLQSNYVQAHIESYIGLPEAALGILPAWGGCKEMLSRFKNNKSIPKGPMPAILKAFEVIGSAKVSSSAHEAIQFGFLKKTDGITMNRNRLLYDAKVKALELIKDYKQPKKNNYNLPGITGFSAMKLYIDNLRSSGQISKHDQYVGETIAHVLSGGTTDINKQVDEEYISKLEKNAISKLFKKNLTIERIEHILETGKYLRN
ncbi:MAG: putative 3-hydroxyacyl-CoA dehydrogenase [Alphaproteobacteria bacterium MarineAlpha5_Bin9]|nr:MAG: putative 3-hydroxyacyl-CoA dehydrogenase [Alphaproteobacteria bacterium MarineAlpha5_Bin9]